MTASASWFQGRRAALGTMHRKEAVIAPLMRDELGVDVVVPPNFNTDRFGAFTREIERSGTQLDAARLKARAAMEVLGLNLGIASEGSFGGHPLIPFAPGNVELVVLIDDAAGLEIRGVHIAAAVRFTHAWVASVDEALAFSVRAGFPEHGLVVRRGPDDPRNIIKEIASVESFRAAVEEMLALTADGRAFIESDLRAHRNPVRMEAIRAATADLVANAKRCCPSCGTPGFCVVADRPGLPCRWCGTPTERTLALVYECQRCQHQSEVLHPHGRVEAEPGECPYCNP
jgi:hypothetical protein